MDPHRRYRRAVFHCISRLVVDWCVDVGVGRDVDLKCASQTYSGISEYNW
jgi:hypothetical protein